MAKLSTTAALAIAAILALLLIVYVFTGDTSGRAAAAPHCTSPQALDQVKGELFRRAAAIRQSEDSGFEAVSRYSVVRAGSRLVRRHHAGSNKVDCSGSIAFDLPPGSMASDGRRTLAANLRYELAPARGGRVRLVTLSKADAIVLPLASIGGSESQTVQQTAPAPVGSEVQQQAPAAVSPRAAIPPPPAPRRAAPPAPAPAAKKAAPATSIQPGQPAKGIAAKPRPNPAAPTVTAAARPSFNCRYARTRGEVAVCSSPGLASLDREMSAQFYQALAVASPGQREMLQRSRNRFLKYRDSCGSNACIATAYQGRIAEIHDIMSGNW